MPLLQKSKPVDLFASAAKEAAQQARALAQEAEKKAATNSKSFHLLASAAKEEAQQARARAQEADNKAEVYKDIAEYALKFAHDLLERAMQQRSGVEV